MNAGGPLSTELLVDQEELLAARVTDREAILNPEALAFLSRLHHEFDMRRLDLLEQRRQCQEDLDAGRVPDFLAETADVRRASWRVAAAPRDLQDRRVEFVAPADQDMMPDMSRLGATVFVADLEDGMSPMWRNVIVAQKNLIDATLSADRDAALIVRPRGLHLLEKHVLVDGVPMSAALFDFGLHFFHNARVLIEQGSGPYYSIAKMESRLEARLWNDIFVFAEEVSGIPRGSVRATAVIETVGAAFEMEEILYELREHASGLSASCTSYVFGFIRAFRHREALVLAPQRQICAAAPFLRSYLDLMVRTCHRRGAHAIGDEQGVEAQQGFDGTQVRDVSAATRARAQFDAVLGDAPHQKHAARDDIRIAARDLLDPRIKGASITRPDITRAVESSIRYFTAWLAGQARVSINGHVADTAHAEVERAQLWQWRRHEAVIDSANAYGDATADAQPARVTADVYREIRNETVAFLRAGADADTTRIEAATELLDRLVLSSDFMPYLTLPAYRDLA
jgi:malate synthase